MVALTQAEFEVVSALKPGPYGFAWEEEETWLENDKWSTDEWIDSSYWDTDTGEWEESRSDAHRMMRVADEGLGSWQQATIGAGSSALTHRHPAGDWEGSEEDWDPGWYEGDWNSNPEPEEIGVPRSHPAIAPESVEAGLRRLGLIQLPAAIQEGFVNGGGPPPGLTPHSILGGTGHEATRPRAEVAAALTL